ncbi:hypothetical protein ACFUJR_32585 [Streptomyces sp. NPDC057271]|uniref:hypothetical protein n=1 Tax=unclassified Streptomyces TaxID=2593676 RepID=UPI003628DFAF
MATSAVPAAIAELVEILRAAPGLSGVDVADGPPTGDQSGPDLVAVGWQPESGQAAEAVQDFNAAGARTRDEDFDIQCWIDSWSGDSSAATPRERVYELLGAVEDAIRASGADPAAPTLNGTVLWSHLTRHSLRQQFTDDGMQASLPFTITCRARI